MSVKARVVATRPSSRRYQHLLDCLAEVNDCIDSGADHLKAVWVSVAVIEFLDNDRAVDVAALTRPLHILASALSDRLRGAKPPLLFEQPTHVAGRPGETTFGAARGAIAAILDDLIEGGEAAAEACRFIVNELNRLGIRSQNGKPITKQQVRHWREQADVRGDRRIDVVFREHKMRRAQLGERRMPREELRAHATARLLAVKATGF